ncbi:MAG: hypothetical protein F6K35_12570 [Okeania sp. SIO2H7]|nr:hypothetical protein [Okeania sp. SIO2H7]
MTKNNSNQSISQLLSDLEEMQHYLLMIKAAALAFDGVFNENCLYSDARSPYGKEETAQYFVWQFLELDPDAKLEQAMDIICSLRCQLKTQPEPSHKTEEATIKISIERD